MPRGLVIALWIIGVIVVFGGIAALAGYGGVKKAVQLTIGDVDLSKVPDGSYRGSYDGGRFSNTVEVQVADHKIVGIKTVTDQKGGSLSQQVFDLVLAKQSPAIDGVSGATASSHGYLKAIENALVNAGGR
jgi:uncharacterized protein with FMN-binding domain